MQWISATCCLVVVSLGAACRPAPVEPVAHEPAVSAALSEPVPEASRLPLAARLVEEAEGHPDARQHVTDWLARFQRADVTLLRTRQVLAAPLLGNYCATGVTAAGLGFALCAFDDTAAAERGMQRSRATFERLIPGRTLLVRAATLLTLTRPDSEASRADMSRLRAAFEGSYPGESASL